MIRFSHTLFALPFALLAAVMAWAANRGATRRCRSAGRTWLGILVCMVAARSAAMAFNRLADRRLDALNPRTQMRHLPSGRAERGAAWPCSPRSARLGFVAGTLLFLPRNRIPLAASRAGAAVPVRLQLRQAVHGAGPFLAGRGVDAGARWRPGWRSGRRLAWPPVVLGGAVLLWVAGFDIIYACQDCRVRRGDAAAQRARPAGRRRRPAAGRGVPPGHGRAAGGAAAGLSLRSARLPGRRRRHRACCWSTSTRWSGPTT